MTSAAFAPGDIVVLKSEERYPLTVVGPSTRGPGFVNCVWYDASSMPPLSRFAYVDLPEVALKPIDRS